MALNQVVNSLLDYFWVLLLEAGGDDLRGLAVLVHEIVTDNGKLFGYILYMVEH